MLGWRDERALSEVIPEKEARAIFRGLTYQWCWELLEHFPRAYARHGGSVDLYNVAEGDVVTVFATVVDVNTRPTRKRTKSGRPMMLTTVTLADEGTTISAVYFGSWYAEKELTPGVRAIFSGKIGFYQGRIQLTQPDFYKVGSGSEAKATGSLKKLAVYGSLESLLGQRRLLPIYPATSKISSWQIMGAIDRILSTIDPLPEVLHPAPEGMVSFDAAVRGIHGFGEATPVQAVERLKYNEALELALVMALRRRDISTHTAPELPRREGGQQDQVLRNLPFPLTRGQQEVLSEISADISGTHPMSRLLQGEVGSGKTIVALLAMLQAIDNGHQCAMLVPTEVLTIQHARSLTATLMNAGSTATVVAVTSSMGTAAKREALLKAISGEADIVVGTHALIQDSVEFFDLGLVIVDEQHRFGVEQRDRLREKGREGVSPHMLVMTATPIPRTVAITVFGDLEVSTLRELPGGRKPITSSVVPEAKPRWVARAWERIREEVTAGHQAYVVCPRIDNTGGVLEVGKYLAEEVFPEVTVEIVHGRLSSEEKDQAMSLFARGKIDIIVATTVIEVGVDVPNATVMMVRESEHFGVSQLHQLRGRVGRGGHASVCLFHTAADLNTPAFERVSRVAATSDGFELASLDLATRQEGDVLGTHQSGTQRTLKLLNLLEDYLLIEQANEDAAALVARDPEYARQLTSNITENTAEYLDKT